MPIDDRTDCLDGVCNDPDNWVTRTTGPDFEPKKAQ